MADDRFYVKTLTLENFRCFEKAELGPFDPHFNLLVGENGAGKSSVLLALADLFAAMGVERGRSVPSMGGSSDIRRHEKYEDVWKHKLPFHAILGANFFPATSPSATEFRTQMDAQLSYSEDSAGALVTTRTSGVFLILTQPEQFGESTAIPLIAFYKSDRRFLAGNRENSLPEKLSSSRYAGLLDWANSGAESEALTKWLYDETLAKYQGDARIYLSKSNDDDIEKGYFIDLVNNAVSEGVEGAKSVEYRGAVSEISLTYSDGRKQKLSEMSDGQRAIICLFADIARRMCILNGGSLQGRALEETTGLVLIDEIDLHLHPKWQRQIVPALKKVFPKIQFFATTHSPQVIGSARPQEIVVLTPEGQQRPGPSGSLGRDSNWVLECVMGAEGRDPRIAQKLKAVWEAIDKGAFRKAQGLIKKLRREIGDDPDIIGAESYIWRIEHVGDEAAE